MSVSLDPQGHLLADSREELETMARRIGLVPAWIQRPGTVHEHDDITSLGRRRLAVRLGAEPITLRQTARIIAQRRQEDDR